MPATTDDMHELQRVLADVVEIKLLVELAATFQAQDDRRATVEPGPRDRGHDLALQPVLALSLLQLLDLILFRLPLAPCPAAIPRRQIDDFPAHPVPAVKIVELEHVEQFDNRRRGNGLVLLRAEHRHEVLPRVGDQVVEVPEVRKVPAEWDDVVGHVSPASSPLASPASTASALDTSSHSSPTRT